MEINHGLAPGAVVGNATTHEWGVANHGNWRQTAVNSYKHASKLTPLAPSAIK